MINQLTFRPTSRRIAILLVPLCLLVSIVSSRAQETSAPPDKAVSFEWLGSLQSQLEKMGVTLDPAQTSHATILAVVRTVDPQAQLMDAPAWTRFQMERGGRAFLPGIRLGMTNGLPFVSDFLEDSPAKDAGMMIGDVITGIGTQRFDKIALPEAQRLLMSASEEPLPIRYIRNELTNTIPVTPRALQQPSVEVTELLPNNIGYIKVNGLYRESGRELVTRLRAWSETKRDGIVLDLRGADGSDDEAVGQVASLFCPDGQFLFAYRDHHHQDLSVYKSDSHATVMTPIMVLVDHRTTGAAETLAAVLNGAAHEALVVGETTPGDFNLRSAITISSQLIYMATRVLDTADGIRYTGHFGLEPSVEIDVDETDTHDYEPPADLTDHRRKIDVEERDQAARRRVRGDGVLQRSVDILIGLKSLNKAPGGVSSPELPP